MTDNLLSNVLRLRAIAVARVEETRMNAENLRDLYDATRTIPAATEIRSRAAQALANAVNRYETALRALDALNAAVESYQQRMRDDIATVLREAEEFATDWIVQHGLKRGMPQGWNQ